MAWSGCTTPAASNPGLLSSKQLMCLESGWRNWVCQLDSIFNASISETLTLIYQLRGSGGSGPAPGSAPKQLMKRTAGEVWSPFYHSAIKDQLYLWMFQIDQSSFLLLVFLKEGALRWTNKMRFLLLENMKIGLDFNGSWPHYLSQHLAREFQRNRALCTARQSGYVPNRQLLSHAQGAVTAHRGSRGLLYSVCGTGDWTQGFTHARQALYYFRHTAGLLCCGGERGCLPTAGHSKWISGILTDFCPLDVNSNFLPNLDNQQGLQTLSQNPKKVGVKLVLGWELWLTSTRAMASVLPKNSDVAIETGVL
jgi:hypothetical protein